MLNELRTLSGVLDSMRIEAKTWHREYKPIPATGCIRLWLSDTGNIGDVSALSDNIAAVLRKFGNNQASFPAFNILPLYRITDERQIRELKSIQENHSLLDADTIKGWCVSDNWAGDELPDLNKKVQNCIVGKGRELLNMIEKEPRAGESVVAALVARATLSFDRAGAFRAALEAHLFQKLQKAEDIGLCLKVLFHCGDEKKPHKKDRGSNLSVVLDLLDWETYGFPVATERATDWINDVLLNIDEKDIPQGEDLDAFGDTYSDMGQPMPNVKLKGFDVTLRAMFNAQQCQYRYGKIDDQSYPINEKNRYAAGSALNWIAKPENRGLTWQTVDKNELVFVYPSTLPETPIRFAAIFRPQEDDDAKTGMLFAEIAKQITASLSGIPPDKVPKNIHVFSIKKMDKARSKVIFNRNCTPEWFVRSAKEWQAGCENIPPLDIRFFPPKNADADKKKPKPIQLQPLVPYPLQLPPIINNVWKQNGELAQGRTAATRMHYYQGMEVLLDPVREDSIRYYLNVLLSNSIGLIQFTGNQQHRRLASGEKQARNIGLLLSAFGLLLYKCGYRKEDYMEDTAYLVGQILKISDELHALYCEIVRQNEIPPQLAGNSMFATASESPNQAFAQLGTRMAPYIAWSTRYRTLEQKKRGLARWYLNLYKDTADKLKLLLKNDTRFNDFDKAQLFLGYLASFPKQDASGKAFDNNDDAE